jgi:hypothetical protein
LVEFPFACFVCFALEFVFLAYGARIKELTVHIVAMLLALTLATQPKEREGVTAQPTIDVGGARLHLMGLGLRKKLFFKVYLAAFYLENPSENAKEVIASDQVKRVQMHMLRDLDKGKIVEAVEEGFKKNSEQQMPALRERLDRFLKSIPDLKSGETIVLTYMPGAGTRIKAGSGEEIEIQGKDFSDALFSVWLGEHPVDDGLKDEMLRDR